MPYYLTLAALSQPCLLSRADLPIHFPISALRPCPVVCCPWSSSRFSPFFCLLLSAFPLLAFDWMLDVGCSSLDVGNLTPVSAFPLWSRSPQSAACRFLLSAFCFLLSQFLFFSRPPFPLSAFQLFPGPDFSPRPCRRPHFRYFPATKGGHEGRLKLGIPARHPRRGLHLDHAREKQKSENRNGKEREKLKAES
jgi:hypothetical protein